MINRLDIAEEIQRIWDKGTKSMKQHVQTSEKEMEEKSKTTTSSKSWVSQ